MTWEEKLAAMMALVGPFTVSLRMRTPGTWYVHAKGRDIGNGVVLMGKYGDGKTPEEAVNADWGIYTNLKTGERVVIDGMTGKRRAATWNGYMWEPFNEEAKP